MATNLYAACAGQGGRGWFIRAERYREATGGDKSSVPAPLILFFSPADSRATAVKLRTQVNRQIHKGKRLAPDFEYLD